MEPPPPTGYLATRLPFDERRAHVWRHVARYLERFVDPARPVLDLGCGYGDFLRHVRATRRVGLDMNPSFAPFIPPGVEFRVGDAGELTSFDDAEFGTVFASNVLEHLERDDIPAVLAQVRRVLAGGGRLILVQPNFRLQPRRYFDDYTHRTIFTDVSLADLVAVNGFDIEHSEPRFLPLTMRSRIAWGHRLTPLYLRSPLRPLAGQMLLVGRRSVDTGAAAEVAS